MWTATCVTPQEQIRLLFIYVFANMFCKELITQACSHITWNIVKGIKPSNFSWPPKDLHERNKVQRILYYNVFDLKAYFHIIQISYLMIWVISSMWRPLGFALLLLMPITCAAMVCSIHAFSGSDFSLTQIYSLMVIMCTSGFIIIIYGSPS